MWVSVAVCIGREVARWLSDGAPAGTVKPINVLQGMFSRAGNLEDAFWDVPAVPELDTFANHFGAEGNAKVRIKMKGYTIHTFKHVLQ